MGNVTTKIGRLKADTKRWGWKRTLLSRVASYLSRYLGIHIHVVRTAKMVSNPQYPSTLPGVVYRLIQAEELLKASSDPELRLHRGFVEAAIDRGDYAFGAFDGPTLVSYIWRSLGAAPHTGGLWVRVNKPHCYAYKSFTRPTYRGYRLSPAVHLFSDMEMMKKGYEYRSGFARLNNSASLAVGKHIGSHPIGYAGYVKCYGRYFPFRTRSVKKIGFEFFERQPD